MAHVEPRRTTGATYVDETGHNEGAVVRREVVDEVVVDPVTTETSAARRVGTTMTYDSLAGRVNTLLFAALLALEGLLATRFALAAFGANPTSGFVDFIYDISYPFVRPFQNAFADRTWDEGIVEVSTLLAMGVYFVAFLLITMVVGAVMPKVATSETRVRDDRVTHV